MSKREQKLKERTRSPVAVTRRQQVAALRQVKGNEIAEAVAGEIREAVKQEVETQLKPIKSTMMDLIDRVMDLESEVLGLRRACIEKVVGTEEHESDSDSGSKRAEASPIQQDHEVVPESMLYGGDHSGQDY